MIFQGTAEEKLLLDDVVELFEQDRVESFVIDDSYYLTMKVIKADESGALVTNADGSFVRSDEEQTERCYTLEEIKDALQRANLEFLGVWSDYDFSPVGETTERWYFAARAKK